MSIVQRKENNREFSGWRRVMSRGVISSDLSFKINSLLFGLRVDCRETKLEAGRQKVIIII